MLEALDLKETQVQRGVVENLDHLERTENQVVVVRQEKMDLRELCRAKESRESQDQEGNLDPLVVLGRKVFQGSWDHLDFQGCLDQLDKLEIKEMKVFQDKEVLMVCQDSREKEELLVLLEKMELMVNQGPQVLLDPQEKQVLQDYQVL